MYVSLSEDQVQNPTKLTAHFGGIRQLGYVVADLDASLDEWRRKGIGPWTIMRNVCLNAVYRGAPSRPLIDIALAYRGDVQIELIQQRNDAPSPYQARIAAGRYGLHHIAFLCADIGADVRRAESLGWQVVCDIRMPGSGRYVYLQSPRFGDDFHIEFLEASPVMRRIFAVGMAETARTPNAETLEFDLASWASKLKQGAWMCGLPLRRDVVGSASPGRQPQLDRLEYTVPDLTVAINAWQTQLGIGPWQRAGNGAKARSGTVAISLSLVESACQPSRGLN